jgi:hypothetical protein
VECPQRSAEVIRVARDLKALDIAVKPCDDAVPRDERFVRRRSQAAWSFKSSEVTECVL